MATESALRHLGVGLGRLRLWHDGLGEFSRQLGLALAERATELRSRDGIALHFHLPRAWHGVFGNQVGYLDTHTSQRWLHPRATRFSLWHHLHQHLRLRAPLGTRAEVETVHDLNFLHTKTPAKQQRYRAILSSRLQRRAAVVAITRHVAEDLARELPGLRRPVEVIHNGATDLSLAARTAVAEAGDGPFLLHISRMAPSKNIEALLQLAAAWPQMPLVLAGATSAYTDTVRRLVAERGLANVRIRLDLDEAQKAWLYAHCTAFLFPSLTEGFGLPAIEAMYFGKPVFLSRLTSLPEVGGDAACYFDAFDGATMRSVVEHGLLRHALPGRADVVREHAHQFSWSRCADAYVDLYRRQMGAAA
ncbi:MAG: glycosyltransferase family 4 protein [Aquabacterium sp.]